MPPGVIIPVPPRATGSVSDGDRHAAFLAHVEELKATLASQRAEREVAGRASRAASDAAALAIHFRHNGMPENAAGQMSTASANLALSLAGRDEEEAFFSHAAQSLAAAQAFDAFLATGTLGVRSAPREDWAPRAPGSKKRKLDDEAEPGAAAASAAAATVASYTDEEWLGGLVSAAHEIGRYASVAATAGDVASVEAARAVVGALHEAMQAFDLRNGNLRRSFDSLKYVVRRLEDTIYELSLFPPPAAAATAAAPPTATAAAAAAAAAAPAPLVDVEALEAAREAYAALDAAREAVIKKCREPQKLAKQAIFALQRGDSTGGRRQLEAARKLARAVLAEDVATNPALRQQGALKGMLEELAEAALFEAWMRGADAAAAASAAATADADADAAASSHPLLLRGDEALLGSELQPAEYLGGVCDLVGEIGRYAVRRATERDAAAVRASLGTAVAVQSAMLALGSSAPKGLHKKADALRTAVRKLEQLLYELSLVERSGRVRDAPPLDAAPDVSSGGAAAEEE